MGFRFFLEFVTSLHWIIALVDANTWISANLIANPHLISFCPFRLSNVILNELHALSDLISAVSYPQNWLTWEKWKDQSSFQCYVKDKTDDYNLSVLVMTTKDGGCRSSPFTAHTLLAAPVVLINREWNTGQLILTHHRCIAVGIYELQCVLIVKNAYIRVEMV